MGQLEEGLWVVKTEERYEPTFTYHWDLGEAWLPELVAEGRRLSRAAALDRLLERYVTGAVFASPARLARLLGVPRAEIAACIARLTRSRKLLHTSVAGWSGTWLVAV